MELRMMRCGMYQNVQNVEWYRMVFQYCKVLECGALLFCDSTESILLAYALLLFLFLFLPPLLPLLLLLLLLMPSLLLLHRMNSLSCRLSWLRWSSRLWCGTR
jgi:hypothetical protein